MQTGSTQPTINMTPLIDVLLVLLIIFMILIPQRSVGLEAKAPQPAPDAGPVGPSNEIVVSIAADGNIRINTQQVSLGELGESLQTIFARRAAKVLFLNGDPSLEFGVVANVIDLARGAGIHHCALMSARTPK